MTSDPLELLNRLPQLDFLTACSIIIGLSLVRYLVRRALDEGDVPQCPARRAGYRCVHFEDHRGSHRDELGEHWNDQ